MLNVVIGTGWQDPFAEFEFCERESGLAQWGAADMTSSLPSFDRVRLTLLPP